MAEQNKWLIPEPDKFNPLEYAFNLAATPVYKTSKLLADIPGLDSVFGPIRDSGLLSRQEDFETQHPLSSGAAELASWFVPGAGWFKATEGLGALKGIAGGVNAATKSPTLGVAAAEAARWFPFAAAQTGLEGAAGRFDSVGEGLGDLAINTAIGGAFGAIGPHIPNQGLGSLFHVPAKEWYGVDIAGASQLGKRVRSDLSEVAPHLSDINPFPIQGRQIIDGVSSGAIPADAAAVELPKIHERILGESVAGGQRYANFSSGGKEQIDTTLNNMYRRQRSEGVAQNSFQIPKENIAGRSPAAIAGLDVNTIQTSLGFVPENDLDSWLHYVQYPTIHVSPAKVTKDGKVMQSLLETTRLNRDMTTLEPGSVWIAREPDDGLWHVVQKLDQRAPGGGKGQNRFVVFKTDSPDRFLGRFKYEEGGKIWRSADDVPLKLGINAWNGRLGQGVTGGSIFNSARDFVNAIPLQDFRTAMKIQDKNAFSGIVKKAFEGSDIAKKADDFLGRFVRPAVHQFKHPLAARSYMVMAAVKDNTARTVRTKIEGIEAEIRKLWAEGKGEDVIEHGIRKLTHEDLILDPDVKKFIVERRKEGQLQVAEINATKRAVGDNIPLKELDNHLGISRIYDGDFFIPIKDKNGVTLALASAYSEAGAAKEAARIVDFYQTKRGHSELNWDPQEMFTRDSPKLPKEFAFVRGNPGFANPRGDIGGYQWDIDAPTADEFVSAFNSHYTSRANFNMRMSLDYFLWNDITKLKDLDPKAYDALVSRFQSLLGEQGEFERWQNKVTDTVLAPYIGKDSASKVAAKITEVNHHLQLGMGNVAYAAMNALSIPIQLPAEASMLLTASAPKLSQAYTFFPTAGADGKLNGMQAIPKVFKTMADAFRWTKDDGSRPAIVNKIFARASEDGLHDPQYIEEWSGRMKTAIGDLKSATNSGEGFVKWLGAVSNFMGAQTEKFMRSYSIGAATSAILHRWPTIPEEQLYQYVKRFVGRTAFEYNRYSRPEIFTTPIGQVFGGFKTWQMNYLHILGDYTAEAGRGNFGPLMWAIGSTGTLGGMAALPFLPAIADQYSQLMEDKPFMQYAYDNFGETAGDAIYFGLPSVLLGVSATPNISLPGSHLSHDAEMLFGVAALERAKNMARSLGSIYDSAIVAGVDPMSSPKVAAQIMQGWSPRSLYRVYQTFQDGIQGGSLVSPSTGYKTIDGLGPYQQAMYMLGFSPTDLERKYQVYEVMMNDKETRKVRTTQLGEAWAQAQSAGDKTSLELIARRAAAEGVDISSVLRSANRRLKDMSKDQFGRNFSQDEIDSWDQVLE